MNFFNPAREITLDDLYELYEVIERNVNPRLFIPPPLTLISSWHKYREQWQENRHTLQSNFPIWQIDFYLDYYDAIDRYVK